MSDPEPCPFCGRRVSADPVPARTGRSIVYEIHHRCPVVGRLLVEDPRRDDLIHRWNSRAPTQETGQ